MAAAYVVIRRTFTPAHSGMPWVLEEQEAVCGTLALAGAYVAKLSRQFSNHRGVGKPTFHIEYIEYADIITSEDQI